VGDCAAPDQAASLRAAAPAGLWSYSGVRPLYNDGASEAKKATRDYVLETDAPSGAAPVISIFGGKITTYRRLAEEVMRHVETVAPMVASGGGWTARSPLPGGDFPVDGLGALIDHLRRSYPFLAPDEADRLARAYGTRASLVLGAAKRRDDLGMGFGDTLTEAEARYLVDEEWAETPEDILWRRSKLGLRLTQEDSRALEAWMDAYVGRTAAPSRRSGGSGDRLPVRRPI
jgi:glycerol-3-phosphate dehydrogenase